MRATMTAVFTRRVLPLLAAGLAACAATPAPAASAPQRELATLEGAAGAENLATNPEQRARLQSAIASPERPADETARDRFRHPQQTLEFFGVRDDSQVVELWPGGGWYTAILAPLLAARGALIVTSLEPKDPAQAQAARNAQQPYAQRLAARPDIFGQVKVQSVDPTAGVGLRLGEDNSADVVLTFRNFHNWVKAGNARDVLAASFAVLKHGGVFGVEEHRAAERAGANTADVEGLIASSGYVPESYVIALARGVGFELEARSELNANPSDTKDWPQGVWTLPPSLRLGDQDRAKYQAIGESDRMTLRFRKP